MPSTSTTNTHQRSVSFNHFLSTTPTPWRLDGMPTVAHAGRMPACLLCAFRNFLSLFDRRCACGRLLACFSFSCLSGCLLANAAPFSQAGVPLPGRREFVPLFQPRPRGRVSLVLSRIYKCDAAFHDRCNASHRYRPMACLTFCNLRASRILNPLPSLLTYTFAVSPGGML